MRGASGRVITSYSIHYTKLYEIIVAVCGALAIILLVAFIVILVRNTRSRLRLAEERDAKQRNNFV